MKKSILKKIRLPDNYLVLDLGCGDGKNRKLFKYWIGIDIVEKPHVMQKDILDYLKHDEKKYDLIISEFSLQQNKDRANKITDLIYKHPKPNGYFYLASFNEETENGKWFSPEEYDSMIRGTLLFFDRYEIMDPPHGSHKESHSHNITELLVRKLS